jgi:hypothetical protein
MATQTAFPNHLTFLTVMRSLACVCLLMFVNGFAAESVTPNPDNIGLKEILSNQNFSLPNGDGNCSSDMARVSVTVNQGETWIPNLCLRRDLISQASQPSFHGVVCSWVADIKCPQGFFCVPWALWGVWGICVYG